MTVIQHLVVEEFGRHVGKHQGRLRVTESKTGVTVVEAPLIHLESVLIGDRGVSISADAIAACVEQGIPINFVDSHGNPYAALYSAGLTGTVLTRRAQLAAYQDARGRAAAVGFCAGKLRNQCNLLRYMAKYRKDAAPDVYDEVRCCAAEVLDHVAEIERLGGQTVNDIRFELLSAEGRGAQRYWHGVRALLKDDLDWPGRRTHGATDPLNSALNYGYGILYGQVERAVVLAGLDPFGGFLHVDRSGKPSLVLDLIEEFRAAVVDRAVLAMVNKGSSLTVDESSRLDEATRKGLAGKVLERLDAPVRVEGRQSTLRTALQKQARHLAVFLRGEVEAYRPFIAGW
jgi:CRISPR-associated protein Cas1